MNIMRALLFTVCLLGFISGAKAQECACPAEPPAAEEALSSASLVFVGVATETEELRSGGYTTVFSVLAAWKGFPTMNDTARARPDDGDVCFYPFQVGKTYLIYGDNTKKTAFNASKCGSTREISSLDEAIKLLGPPAERE